MSQRPGPADSPADLHRVPRDSVDRLIADWRRVWPDLDVSPLGVISRLERARGHFDAQLERLFAEYHLSGPSFAVLVTLARLNAPGGVSQRRLMDELGLTSGTISVRMDRLVEQGLVERQADADDKRNTCIILTSRGRALFERVVPAHLDNERRLLASLAPPEIEVLAALLRKLLVEFEGSQPLPDGPAGLGMTLAPAHVTIAMRRAVGLPGDVGLLVRGVADGGPAAAAGIRHGDVLIGAGDRELRSVAALYAALAEAAAIRQLRLRIVRGTASLTLDLALADADVGRAASPAETVGRGGYGEHVI